MNNKKNYGCLYEGSAGKKKNSMCQPATGSVWMTLETERHKQEQKTRLDSKWESGRKKIYIKTYF